MRKKYQIVLLAVVFLLTTAAAGCGSGSKNSMSGMGGESYESAAADAAALAEAPAEVEEASDDYEMDAGAGAVTSESGIDPVMENGRKLIKNVRLEMQTREYDQVIERLTKKVQEIGGYVENSSVWGSSIYQNSTRNSEYTVRIPSDRLNEFVDVVSGLGNVTYKNEYVEDVTLQYVYVESHKKALEMQQDRLLELLEQAENLEDLLTIESRLSEVRYELENYESQKRILDNQIDYSTVSISIVEVERLTETRQLSFFEEIAEQFGDSLYRVGRGTRGFIIGFVGSLPILAVWALVIAAFVVVIRRIFYREKKEDRGFWRKKTPEEKPEDPADRP